MRGFNDDNGNTLCFQSNANNAKGLSRTDDRDGIAFD